MRYRSASRSVVDSRFDTVVVPVSSGGHVDGSVLAAVGPRAAEVQSAARRVRLDEPGASARMIPGPVQRPDYLLVGVGTAADGQLDRESLRIAAMTAGRSIDHGTVACLLALGAPQAARAIVPESWIVGSYHFHRYRTGPAREPDAEVEFWGVDAMTVSEGTVFANATNRTRDLVNTPGGDLTPVMLAEQCRQLGANHDMAVTVLARDELEDGGFGGLLGVGAGSVNPPVLVEIERGNRDLPHVALVGKGITFDSGGLSLKSTKDMLTMKADMSGAAAILSALVAADELGAETHVRAYLACAENMPGGSATRIGDVLRHRNGVTTEVLDTDCEGRLVLADALSYAVEHGPSRVIDVATLTSSTGLGPDMWAGIGTDDPLIGELLDAGAESGEPGWQLPFWAPYAARLRSDVADLRNTDPTVPYPFGAVLAAQFLRSFVGTVPWAHIDLALTVMRPTDTHVWRAGSNGNGTRTLARYLAGSR